MLDTKYMLAKPLRFHGHQAVRRAYRQGRQVRNNLGSLHVFAGDKVPKIKVAVVASRKLAKSAVVRNRIRRRIYEILRSKIPIFKVQAQLVLTVYNVEAAKMPAQQLERLVDELLERGKVI